MSNVPNTYRPDLGVDQPRRIDPPESVEYASYDADLPKQHPPTVAVETPNGLVHQEVREEEPVILIPTVEVLEEPSPKPRRGRKASG